MSMMHDIFVAEKTCKLTFASFKRVERGDLEPCSRHDWQVYFVFDVMYQSMAEYPNAVLPGTYQLTEPEAFAYVARTTDILGNDDEDRSGSQPMGDLCRE